MNIKLLDLTDWTRFEKWWLFVFTALIMSATVFFSWTGTDYTNTHSVLLNWVISPVSALTGIVCVVLVAKGKLSNYVWGTLNCLTYGYVAYFAGYYGDAILNIFYLLPFQWIGYVLWKKNLKTNSDEDVIMKAMNPLYFIFVLVGCVVATLLIALGLFNIDHWFVNVMKRNVSIYTYIEQVSGLKYLGAIGDASTEVLQILAQILMTLRYAEQWILWIVINVITIGMWSAVVIADSSSVSWVLPIILMWVGYLVNAFYGWYVWKKGSK